MTEINQADAFARREAEHRDLMATLEIPTYQDRKLEAQWVKERDYLEASEYYTITGTSGWTAMCPVEVYNLLPVGKAYILETSNVSRVTGWLIDGKWYDRQSDQELKREHETFVADLDRRRQEMLDANRDEWQRRQDALPDWIRPRLENFHAKGWENFAREGWGYELIIAELAVEYAALGNVILGKDIFEVSKYESEAIRTISREEGTSGNQHGMALALAKSHLKEPRRSMTDTVSALSPITGDAFYEGTTP